MLINIDHWLNQWGHPVWEGIYLGDREACEQKLVEASQAIGSVFSTEDGQAAAKIYLGFLDAQTKAQFAASPEGQTQIRLSFVDRLGTAPPEGELELIMWARTLLTVRCLVHHLGIREASEPEVSDLIEHIPVDDLDHQCISYIAFWAFSLRNSFYLDYTYRLFLTDPFVFMVDFSRQRIKVMRGLVNGNCKDTHIEKLIGLIPHQMHLDWFGDFIIPECQNQGLWTQSMAQQLIGKTIAISQDGPQVPTTRKQVSFQLNF